MDNATNNRSLGELLSDLTRELTTLLRREVELAKTEMTEKAVKTGRDVGFLAIGGAVAYAGFLVLLAALVVGLANAMPAWLAALIVGLVVAAIGAGLVFKGMAALKSENLAPTQTVATLKEDAQWAKRQLT